MTADPTQDGRPGLTGHPGSIPAAPGGTVRKLLRRMTPQVMGVVCALVAVVLWVLVIAGVGHTTFSAVEWTVGAVALLTVTRPRAGPDGFRLSRRVIRHRDVRYADIDRVELPHPLSTNSTATIVVLTGERIAARGFAVQALDQAARDHHLTVVTQPAPRRPTPPARPDKPMDVGREADLIRRRDLALRRQLDELRRTRPARPDLRDR